MCAMFRSVHTLTKVCLVLPLSILAERVSIGQVRNCCPCSSSATATTATTQSVNTTYECTFGSSTNISRCSNSYPDSGTNTMERSYPTAAFVSATTPTVDHTQ